MFRAPIWQAIESTPLGTTIASSEWAFPTIETLHVIFVATVVGTILIMDLRLLGLTSRSWSVSSVSKETLWLTWLAFAGAVVTGLLMFVSKASTYMVNPYFLWKMFLIVLAGLNMAYFHRTTWRSIAAWDSAAALPASARAAGAISLIFWIAVVFCGRVIGFTLGIYY